MNKSVSRLVRAGHTINDIRNYTLRQFVMFIEAIDQLDADARVSTVSDLATVIGSLFAKENPVAEHIALLQEVSVGVKAWPQKATSTYESPDGTIYPQHLRNSNPE